MPATASVVRRSSSTVRSHLLLSDYRNYRVIHFSKFGIENLHRREITYMHSKSWSLILMGNEQTNWMNCLWIVILNSLTPEAKVKLCKDAVIYSHKWKCIFSFKVDFAGPANIEDMVHSACVLDLSTCNLPPPQRYFFVINLDDH